MHVVIVCIYVCLQGGKRGCSTMQCRVQYLDDTDPFNCANFPEPTRPIVYTFLTDVPLVNQIVSLKRLLGAPHYVTYTLFSLLYCHVELVRT